MIEKISSLKIELETFKGDNTINLDGITFSNINIIKLIIDDVDLRTLAGFEDMLIYDKELIKSLSQVGKYLILTCACGVADDGGWDGVHVKFTDDLVFWKIELDKNVKEFVFKKNEYFTQVKNLEKMLNNPEMQFSLEPKLVIFPEEW